MFKWPLNFIPSRATTFNWIQNFDENLKCQLLVLMPTKTSNFRRILNVGLHLEWPFPFWQHFVLKIKNLDLKQNNISNISNPFKPKFKSCLNMEGAYHLVAAKARPPMHRLRGLRA